MGKCELLYEGKVREVYDCDDKLVMVATDRISAFDHILKNKVTEKGAILTQMSKFWFDYTKDVVANHMVSVDVNDMPEFFHKDEYIGRSMLCKKLTMLPVECIVRGYITGSGWASYKENGTVCGIKLPEGLKESEKLPEPIYIFHLRRVLKFLRSSSQVKVLSMLLRLRMQLSLFTRSVQSTL